MQPLYSGLLLIDKPAGMTSHDVVAKVRKHLQQKQVGHAGTLDPAATGLLVLLLGEATKLSNFILSGDKAYEAQVHLGVQTDTGDKDGEVIRRESVDVSEEHIQSAVASLQGDFHWPVPMFSAMKKEGKKLYELAREGVEMEPPKKQMIFEKACYVSSDFPIVKAYVKCAKGGFIRTWGEKLGEALGTVASLESLRRVESSPYRIEQSIPLAEFLEQEAPAGPSWIPMSQVLPNLPVVKVDGVDEKLMKNGQIPHRLSRLLEVEYLARGHQSVKVCTRRENRLLALLQHSPKGYKIQRVFKGLHS